MRGLALPDEVLHKLFYANAVRWIPGLTAASQGSVDPTYGTVDKASDDSPYGRTDELNGVALVAPVEIRKSSRSTVIAAVAGVDLTHAN